jgi:hypothetical protein
LRETFEQLIARMNASAYMDYQPKVKPPKAKGPRRLVKVAESLPPDQAQLLLELLEGRWALSRGLAVRREGATWVVRKLEAGAVEYIVDGGACTCPDYKFRAHRCIHVLATEALQ